MTCPSFEALSLAASEAAPEAVQAHVAECVACRKVVDELLNLRRLGQALPVESPRAASAQAREDALIREARARTSTRTRRRGLWTGAAVGAVAASVAAVVVVQLLPDPPVPSIEPAVAAHQPAPPAPPAALAVRPGADARFERRAVQRGPDAQEEVVVLDSGRLELDVPELAAGHTFRLQGGDVEVVAAQARLTAQAEGGRLTRLEVLSGQARIELPGGAKVLSAGEVWRAPTGATPTRQELAFAAGWSALQAGLQAEAGEHFDHALAANPAGPLAADALYWGAVARADADPEAASPRFQRLVAEHPADPRAAEAALWLARQAEARGAAPEARRWAERAATAEDPELRAAARDTLERLAP